MHLIYSFLDFIFPFEWLSPVFMKNALLAVLVSAPLFGALGTYVVSSRMSFFSDAIGHSALTGIALGLFLGIRNVYVSMILFSMLLGFLIIIVKSKGKSSSDTIIGVFSSTSVAVGLVLLSSGGNFSKYQKYMVGDLLSIQPCEILFLLVCAAALILVWILFYNRMLIVSLHSAFAKSRGIKVLAVELIFALLTAAIVAACIQWTGLLVINSMLVLPAASARFVSASSRRYLIVSECISLFGGIAGLCFSYYTGSASGASIVLANAALFFICLAVSFFKKSN